MKKIITAAAVMALTASLAFAAPGSGKGHGKSGKHGMHGKGAFSHHMAEKLNLSEGQRIQMEQLRSSFRAQNEPALNAMQQTRSEMRAARQAGDTARVEQLRATAKAQHEQMRPAFEAHHQQMLAILTPEQRAQLETMKSERKQNRRGARSR